MRRGICFLGILLVMLVLSPVFAMGHLFMIPMTKWWKLPSVSVRLNLTEQEKEQLHKLFLDTKTKLIDLEADIKKAKLKLKDMIESEKIDEDAIMKQFELLQKERLELYKTRFLYVLRVRKILGFNRFEILKEEILKLKAIRKGKGSLDSPMKMKHRHKHHLRTDHQL